LPTAARLPSTVAWHSDASPDVGYYNAHILWVPFTPCNDDYPGLEFELARDRGGSEIASVSLEEGDALFFTSAVRHRTALRPRSTEVRYSCDVRFFAPADVPARVHEKVSQAPFLWLRAFATKPW
jgi:ectoine hydroxylase-related dioxygenase (phytanoyl-CoA dioxygenase family)